MKTKSTNPFLENTNPAEPPEAAAEARFEYISMDLPMLRLEVPGIPGYHLHWFADYPGRVQRAQMAGYEFVSPDEVRVNPAKRIGADPIEGGNTDMGTRISIATEGGDGKGGLLQFLMKIPLATYKANKAPLNERNALLVEAITRGAIGAQSTESREDFRARYVRATGSAVPSFQVRR